MAVAHYLEALDWQREFIKIHAILGRQEPAPAELPRRRHGDADRSRPARPRSTRARSRSCKSLIAKARDFVTRVYIPDLLAVASFYKDWAGYGAGVGNYLVYGEYPEDDGANPRLFLPSGVIRKRDLVEGRAVRSREDHRARQALLVRVRAAATTRRCTRPRARRSRTTRAPSRPTSGSTPTASTAG